MEHSGVTVSDHLVLGEIWMYGTNERSAQCLVVRFVGEAVDEIAYL